MMRQRSKRVRASDLPTKRVTAPDGTVVQLKVVQANSPTLAQDLLAAFRSNVRRVREERRDRTRAVQDSTQA
jgi:hypothetical protein